MNPLQLTADDGRDSHVTIPMLTPVILFNLVMQIIAGFMVFTHRPLLSQVGPGAPLDTTLLYSLYLYRRACETFQMGYGSAMAWILLLIIAFLRLLSLNRIAILGIYESKGGE